MTSTTGTHGHSAPAAWPHVDWSRLGRTFGDHIAVARRSLAAGRAYEEARTDAGRRRVMTEFLETIR